MSSPQNPLDPFKFHGIDTSTVKNGNVTADCPFCGAGEGHLGIKAKSGEWNCFRCGRKGNVYSFLRELVSLYRHDTKPADYQSLAKARCLPFSEVASTYKDCGLALDPVGWLIPCAQPRKDNPQAATVVQVYFRQKSSRREGYDLIATTGLPVPLYSPFWKEADEDWHPLADPLRKSWPLWICEGHWDALALEAFRRKHKLEFVVAAVPGCGTFKDRWTDYAKGRDAVYLPYDHDGPGEQGMARAAEMLKSSGAKNVHTITWPTKSPKGYDLSDFLAANWKDRKCWSKLNALMAEYGTQSPTSTAAASKLTTKVKGKLSFKLLTDRFRKHFHLDKCMSEAWAVSLATVIAEKMNRDPIWIFVIGPPSSGKTVMLRSMEESHKCVFQSVVTKKTLVSGWKEPGCDDSSLLPQLKDKTLIVKDYTTILRMPKQEQSDLMGILRDAHDGKVVVRFGNNQLKEYPDCQFNIVAGVTHAIHGNREASLGDKFIQVNFLDESHDRESQTRRALTSSQSTELQDKETAALWEVRSLTTAFIDSLLPIKPPPAPSWVVDRMVHLSEIIAHLRTDVPRDYHGNMTCRPQVEIGSRLGKQILTLGRYIAVVLQKKTIDHEVYSIMERVAFDTVSGWVKEVFFTLAYEPSELFPADYLSTQLRISRSSMSRCLNNLESIGVVAHEKVPPSIKRRGRHEHGYQLTERLRDFWRKAKCNGVYKPTFSKAKV